MASNDRTARFATAALVLAVACSQPQDDAPPGAPAEEPVPVAQQTPTQAGAPLVVDGKNGLRFSTHVG